MVYDPVKNRAQREAIVPTERGGESDDRYTMLGRSGCQIRNFVFRVFDSTRTLDTRVEVREDMAIGGCSGVVCLIYNDNLQSCRIKLL